MRRLTSRSSILAMVGAAVLMATSVNAAPFTWTFSGTADSGHWGSDDLMGRDYVLKITYPDSTVPGFTSGSLPNAAYWSATMPATVDIQGLGIIATSFIQMQQLSLSADQLLAIGANQLIINLPSGTLGDEKVLSEWGPVKAIAGGVVVDTENSVNSFFQLRDFATATSMITVCTRPGCAQVGQVPEPSTWLFLSLALVAMVFATRRAEHLS